MIIVYFCKCHLELLYSKGLFMLLDLKNKQFYKKKLDRVGSIDNRPSTDKLHNLLFLT